MIRSVTKMKKIIAIALTAALALSASSCSLVRKIEKSAPDEKTVQNAPSDDKTADTGETSNDKKRCTEDEAYIILSDSLKTEHSGCTIEKTGDMTAESSGEEYYIFSVTLPDAPKEQEGGTPYYVSVEGKISTSLEEQNTTTKSAAETFTVKHGTTDPETGYAYVVEYQGIVKNNNVYCYNFIVYLKDTSTASSERTYKTNYIVSLDGRSSGEQVIKQ